jgi:hypothetical protein
MQIKLEDLRDALRTHPRYAEWDDGDDSALYVQLGETVPPTLAPETRVRGDDRDLVLLLDSEGRIQGIEFV